MAEKKLQFFLSGGASNTDPNLSLGGALSSTSIIGNTLTYTSTSITGVTLIDSRGVVEGICGDLIYINSTNTLAFQKTGGLGPNASDYVDVSTDGDYTLTCNEGDASISVTVVAASLPGSNSTVSLTNLRIVQNLYPDILEAESITGSEKYRHLYLFNNTAGTVSAKVYINPNYLSVVSLSIGFSTLTSGTQDELLADENTAPSGVTFDSPIDADSAQWLTILAGQSIGIFLKRVVPVLSESSVSKDSATLVVERL